MKEYFNNLERTRHIISLVAQDNISELKQSQALTDEEKEYLETALVNLQKFNVSVFERFGSPYQRKIEGTMKNNDLRLVGKFGKHNDCISYSAAEDLIPCIKELMFNCCDCEKEDYKNCPIYAIGISCDVEGTSQEGCPYSFLIKE